MTRKSEGLTRRELLASGAALAAGAAAAPYMLTGRALGAESQPAASERTVLGFIGAGIRGGQLLDDFKKLPEVQVAAVAEVYALNRDKFIAKAGAGCKGYNDYRDLLARPDIDGVVIATPEHWHALNAIHACRAGKDVYCEKPLSHSIHEARQMADAARRYGTVFQTGSQQRSDDRFRRAAEYVLSGRIGKLEWVRTELPVGKTCGWDPDEPVPAGLDWELWLGPAPFAKFNPRRFLYDFRFFYDYAGGQMTNWGQHHNDIAQWAIGASYSGPVKTEPLAADFPTDGLFETAISCRVKHTYASGVVLFTSCNGGNDIHLQGSEGWIKVNRSRIQASAPAIIDEPLGIKDVHLRQSPGHAKDWLECMRTRRSPIADAEVGCRSATVCHLGNIAIRTGKTVAWDPAKEVVTNDDSLNRWLSRPYRSPWKLWG
jgi:predicted dehydrogenase